MLFQSAQTLPDAALVRLQLAEAGTGVATMALAISYLPVLYASYGRRESQLLTLDDPSGERIQPTSLIRIWAPGGDTDRLYRFFGDWENWTADILESHVSYPMLALFRSQHPGQSWITALGVVLDAAVLTCAMVPGAELREPYFMYRRGRRALHEILRRMPDVSHVPAPLQRAQFDVAYQPGNRSSRARTGRRVGPPHRVPVDLRNLAPGPHRLPPGAGRILGSFRRGRRRRAVTWSG